MEKRKSVRVQLMDAAGFIGFTVIGGITGLLCIRIEEKMFDGDLSRLQSFALLFCAIVVMLLMFFIHIIIHEGGHLIFGWLSGYQFSSFRVGNIILVNNNGNLHLKKFSIPGTAGQCLMIPPKEKGVEVPFVLYNLGGVLLNLITAVIGVVGMTLLKDHVITQGLLGIFATVGFVSALLNGIPMTSKQVDNDGMNILKLKNNPKAVKAFVNTFFIHEQITMGKRLREMPEEYFEVNQEETIKDSLSASMLVYRFLRLIDMWKLDESMELGEYILECIPCIEGVHRNMIKLELMYCRVLLDYPKEKIDELYKDKEVQSFLKMGAGMISTPRYRYVYTLLVEKDERKAQEYYNDFYKIFKKYPYKADAETEEELLLKAKKINEESVMQEETTNEIKGSNCSV